MLSRDLEPLEVRLKLVSPLFSKLMVLMLVALWALLASARAGAATIDDVEQLRLQLIDLRIESRAHSEEALEELKKIKKSDDYKKCQTPIAPVAAKPAQPGQKPATKPTAVAVDRATNVACVNIIGRSAYAIAFGSDNDPSYNIQRIDHERSMLSHDVAAQFDRLKRAYKMISSTAGDKRLNAPNPKCSEGFAKRVGKLRYHTPSNPSYNRAFVAALICDEQVKGLPKKTTEVGAVHARRVFGTFRAATRHNLSSAVKVMLDFPEVIERDSGRTKF